MERRGPRGGRYFAVASEESWAAWVVVYHQRVRRRMASEAAIRLGYVPRSRLR